MSEFLDEVRNRLPQAVGQAGEQSTITVDSLDSVVEVIKLASETSTPLEVPGSDPHPNRPILRLDRLDAITDVDEISRILHVQAGCTIAEVEQVAQTHGWTLGVSPALFHEQVGAWYARGAPGRTNKANDPVIQNVAGIMVVLPSGVLLEIRPAPRRAVGPDLIRVVRGARGRLGVIVGASLVAQANVPEALRAFSFPDSAAAQRALTWIRGSGVRPLRTTLQRNQLQLIVEADAPRSQAAEQVTMRVATKNGGVEIPNPVEITVPQEILPASAEVMDVLAAQLDPKGILQP